ncbi:MAG: hypothetical protein LBE27_06075 [Deltaproteobacteria bacterium]|nr:hypothetical protein [Deltaproteobacteria bacterium]
MRQKIAPIAYLADAFPSLLDLGDPQELFLMKTVFFEPMFSFLDFSFEFVKNCDSLSKIGTHGKLGREKAKIPTDGP